MTFSHLSGSDCIHSHTSEPEKNPVSGIGVGMSPKPGTGFFPVYTGTETGKPGFFPVSEILKNIFLRLYLNY